MNVANILFVLSLWFCVYTVLLYPLLLALWRDRG